MKRKHLIIASMLIYYIFLVVFNLGGHGKAASANERFLYLIGKWKGACSLSVSSLTALIVSELLPLLS